MLRRITATLTIHRAPVGVDEDGYPCEQSDYTSWESVDWPVYSIQPRVQEEDYAGGRRTVASGLRISAPVDGPLPGVDDLVTIPGFTDGGPFETDGEIAVWDHNPMLARTLYRGVVVNLERRRR